MKQQPDAHAAAADGETAGCTWGPTRYPLYRPTWVEIDRAAFRNNYNRIARSLKKGTQVLAVVKANAYGHMAVPLSLIAQKSGAFGVGVSSIEEGIALREGGVQCRILLLGSIYPMENFAVAMEHKLTPSISSLKGLAELASLARRRHTCLPFHLKVDTGMGRVGVSPETASTILERIAARREIRMDGMYMHFAAADSDAECTRRQMKIFGQVVKQARGLGLKFTAHAANSAALQKYPAFQLDAVRPGISLYGLEPFPGAAAKLRLEPVLSWKTKIVFLKKVPAGTCISYCGTFVTKRASTIATLPVGYADGYDRSLSNRAHVLVRGMRCPIVGRVTMDMIMVDVTRVHGVTIGDEAVLVGSQGPERITVDELAKLVGTITYEITCGISYRVPRVLL